MPATDREIIGLLHGLTSPDSRVREDTCGTVTDWISVFDPFQARLLAMTLATAAAAEPDPSCRESELHALGELADTGFFGVESFEPVERLDRNTLGPSEQEYLDALQELGE
ncbi:hypothetical protein ACIQBJ_09590 [Kitasatospora sp. NPDC088391]|uniref:hypothetical protein n=1 Tax=Kitasatospora sp. NPDC088391 TaxID=3364074 RepID=UPI003803A04C